MTMREEPFRWLKWGMLLPVVVLNGWLLIQLFEYFSSLIGIFMSANLLAFVLNYPVEWLERHRLSRVRAVTVVFLLALSAVVLLAVTVVPIVASQLSDFVNRLPDWIGSGSQQLEELQNWAIARQFPIDLTRLINQLQDGLSERLQDLSGQLFSFGVGLVGRTLDCLLTLVFTFYLLLHGDRLWRGVFALLPATIRQPLRRSIRRNFQNYFIGQATLAALTGALVILAFLVLGVPFGVLFGVGIGLMALIPFGTSLGIFGISALVALQSIWIAIKVLLVGIVIDQSIQNGLAPRLLGRFTGLNPVWVLVSLLVGVRLAGVLGLLVAVPIAGVARSTLEGFKRDRQSKLS